MKNINFLILMTFACILPAIVFAQGQDAAGFGQLAGNITEPVNFLTNIIHVACYVIGASFLFTAIVKYFEYRRSPLMVPISTVIFLLVAGIILILLPFVSILVGQ